MKKTNFSTDNFLYLMPLVWSVYPLDAYRATYRAPTDNALAITSANITASSPNGNNNAGMSKPSVATVNTATAAVIKINLT